MRLGHIVPICVDRSLLPNLTMGFAHWVTFSALLAWTRASVLHEVCEEGLENKLLDTNATFEDLGVKFLVGTVQPGSSLTVSSLYPLHLEGEFDEALILVTGTATNSSRELYVNLEPGHEGRGCDIDSGDERGMILLDGKPTASYVQLINSGSIQIEAWVSKDAQVGVEKLSFSVIEPSPRETGFGSPILLDDGSGGDTTTPTPSIAPAKALDLDIGHSTLDSVVLPLSETTEPVPTEAQTPSPAPSMAWTFRPTLTYSPTGTSSPSYSTACNICGNPDEVISKPDESVPVLGLLVSCASLQKWSDDGHISPTTCAQVQGPVQDTCGCQEPEVSAEPSPLMTFPPTSSAYPTVTSSPSYSQTCDLEICPDVGASKSVKVMGLAVSCQSLLDSANRNLVSPQVCEVVTDLVKDGCKCERSSAVSTPLAAAPTSSPTFSGTCEICPGTTDFATVTFDGVEYPCDKLRANGMRKLIDPDDCPTVQALAEENCGCAQASVEQTAVPTNTPTQVAVDRSIEVSSSLPSSTGLVLAMTAVTSSVILLLL